MERVLLTELQMLADLLGPDSQAAEAMTTAVELDCPRVVLVGRHLVIHEDGGSDTVSMRRWW